MAGKLAKRIAKVVKRQPRTAARNRTSTTKEPGALKPKTVRRRRGPLGALDQRKRLTKRQGR